MITAGKSSTINPRRKISTSVAKLFVLKKSIMNSLQNMLSHSFN
jgi:hypothetical protein